MKLLTPQRAVVIACALLTNGCATGPDGQPQSLQQSFKSTFNSDDPCSNNARNIGIVGGAVAGAVLNKAFGGGGKGALLASAGVGALVGGLIGADMDQRRCELSKVAKTHNLDLVMTDIALAAPAPAGGAAPAAPNADAPKAATVGMSVTVFDRGTQFVTGSGTPSPEARAAFADVADHYAASAKSQSAGDVQAAKERTKKMRILLVGHTDDVGSSQENADLSEKRAQAIATIFAQRGFDASQIYYQGAGETFPIADNRTDEGRARNRRVEIVDLSDESTFNAFLTARRPNLAHYRPAAIAAAEPRSTTAAAKSQPQSQPQRKIASADGAAGKAKSNAATPAAQPAAAARDAAPLKTPGADTSQAKVAKVAEPAKAPALKTAKASPLDSLDFGGKPLTAQQKSVDIGKTAHAGGFSIISSAYASDDTPLGSCQADRPRIGNRVKSLSSGQSLKTADYLPGTATASWSGKVNGHLLGMTGVAVLRDGAQPAGNPTFFIWKNWVDGSKAAPDLKTAGGVNAYQGDKALLYRAFFADGPVRCIDMVIPNGAPNTAPASTLVYARAGALYQADYSPTIAR